MTTATLGEISSEEMKVEIADTTGFKNGQTVTVSFNASFAAKISDFQASEPGKPGECTLKPASGKISPTINIS